MSNVKISELPSRTYVLGTEVVPVAQASATVKMTLRDIAAIGFKNSGVTETVASYTLDFENDCQRIIYIGSETAPQKIVIPFTAPGDTNGLIFEGVLVGDYPLSFEGVSGVSIVTPTGATPQVALKGGEFKLVRWAQNVWRLYGDLVGTGTTPLNVVNEASQNPRLLTVSDSSIWLRMGFSVANSVGVPKSTDTDFTVGTVFRGVQSGTGITSIVAATAGAGPSATVNTPVGKLPKCRAKGSQWMLVKVGSNEWDLTGDLADA